MVTNKDDDRPLDDKYPARRILALIGDKWTPVVIYCLSGGTRRFGELHARIPDISKKMLTQVLRMLERDGLVRRKVYPVVPPKTEYTLTPLGRRLHEPIAALCKWAMEHPEDLRAIEARRRRANSSDDN
ncbi:MAG TPA: helix-turn-helix domain-containing protein [Tepidisphaeraceae bacterium]|jgi:DNA-binding HxlR family transcriptional regulator